MSGISGGRKTRENAEEALFKTLESLGDAGRHVVLVGGWVPFIYSTYLWKYFTDDIPQTTDIDLGILETGGRRFPETIYDRLAGAGLEMLPEAGTRPALMKPHYKTGSLDLAVDFLSSDFLSNDTVTKFLGKELAIIPSEGLEILLESPLRVEIARGKKRLDLLVPRPERYFFHKGLISAGRTDEVKADKDIYTLWWGLRFAPEGSGLAEKIAGLQKNHPEYFATFRKTILRLFAGQGSKGELKLRPFLAKWVARERMSREIQRVLEPLLNELR